MHLVKRYQLKQAVYPITASYLKLIQHKLYRSIMRVVECVLSQCHIPVRSCQMYQLSL